MFLKLTHIAIAAQILVTPSIVIHVHTQHLIIFLETNSSWNSTGDWPAQHGSRCIGPATPQPHSHPSEVKRVLHPGRPRIPSGLGLAWNCHGVYRGSAALRSFFVGRYRLHPPLPSFTWSAHAQQIDEGPALQRGCDYSEGVGEQEEEVGRKLDKVLCYLHTLDDVIFDDVIMADVIFDDVIFDDVIPWRQHM